MAIKCISQNHALIRGFSKPLNRIGVCFKFLFFAFCFLFFYLLFDREPVYLRKEIQAVVALDIDFDRL
jgi:preprotein translocase subunit SecG